MLPREVALTTLRAAAVQGARGRHNPCLGKRFDWDWVGISELISGLGYDLHALTPRKLGASADDGRTN